MAPLLSSTRKKWMSVMREMGYPEKAIERVATSASSLIEAVDKLCQAEDRAARSARKGRAAASSSSPVACSRSGLASNSGASGSAGAGSSGVLAAPRDIGRCASPGAQSVEASIRANSACIRYRVRGKQKPPAWVIAVRGPKRRRLSHKTRVEGWPCTPITSPYSCRSSAASSGRKCPSSMAPSGFGDSPGLVTTSASPSALRRPQVAPPRTSSPRSHSFPASPAQREAPPTQPPEQSKRSPDVPRRKSFSPLALKRCVVAPRLSGSRLPATPQLSSSRRNSGRRSSGVHSEEGGESPGVLWRKFREFAKG
eukprot:TRINITY_DN42833_c0_g1_i1.p1 TRINITY_DN42833_c0_g1~~TRINITY_DN42833_c0_g1_i1.p1  ORF type:complete len:311 (-),score=42.33 TRINITY_DN42833_c0_g1_i1:313-1245(-)